MRGGKAFIYLTVVLAVLILLNLPLPLSLRIKARLRDGVAPLRGGLAAVENGVRGMASFVGGALRANRDREGLLKEIATLRADLWRLRTMEEDNRELRRLLEFRKLQKHRLVLCQVISRGDASGWWETVTLDKGADSGITTNLAAVTPDGLVGRTLTVSRQTCEVLLISDPNFKVACRVGESDATGIVRGMGVRPIGEPILEMLCPAEPYRMDYLSCDVNIEEGAEVRTSGLGGIYPEGLPVGRIQRVSLDVSGLYQRADVVPVAKLRSLRYVCIVVFRPEG